MRFQIDGVSSDSGGDKNCVVEANTEEEAAAKARALGVLPWKVSEVYTPPLVFSPPSRANNEPLFEKPLTVWGSILIIGGLCVAGFFLFRYDTSTDSPAGRIINLGIQQNRMLGCLAGMVAAAVGAVMVAIDAKMPDKDG
jgi:hypothetical protein